MKGVLKESFYRRVSRCRDCTVKIRREDRKRLREIDRRGFRQKSNKRICMSLCEGRP